MAVPLTGQNVPGGGAPFATDNASVDAGRVQFVKPIWGPDGTIIFIDDATGKRFPVKAVLCDTTDQEVKTGDSALNAQRVTLVGGANVTEAAIDNAPYAVGIDLGIPSLFLVDDIGGETQGIQGAASIARMSKYRLQYVTAPPRNSTVQNNVALTSTAETTLLTAGLAGEFNDIAFLGVYTDDTTVPANVCRKVLFRDATGGPPRYTVPLSEKGGSNIDMGGLRWKQTTAASVWTVALSTAMPVIGGVQSSVFVHVTAERRLP